MVPICQQIPDIGRGLCQHVTYRDLKRFRKLFDHGNRRIPCTPFDVTDIGAVDAGLVSEGFLAPAFGFAQSADILSEALTHIHAQEETPLSPIDLQTMSDICVDFGTKGRTCHNVTHRRQEN